MTLIQEATMIMENMPMEDQRLFVDLLRMISRNTTPQQADHLNAGNFKRTGKASFKLPEDFDEHFDDMNEEIASLFYGEMA